ncbi:MAG: serine/threonine-protein kinase, partial [Gemmataceae bacterium]|nr:serine/threonine-protein kinase [Gemmataceae bacterium]
MTADESLPEEDRYEELFAAGEAAPAATPNAPTIPDVPPELLPRLERDLALVHLLRQALRRPALAPGPQTLPAVPGYEVLGELGRGGMGVVYLAWQQRLRRVVALKVIKAAEYASEPERVRFRTEAEALARLQHPHLVQIYEYGEHAGRPYFVLEYVDGWNLDQHLAGKPQPVGAAAELVETLARAVHHAHQRGVVHRDLKPANILLQRAESGEQRAESQMTHPESGLALCSPLSALCLKITDFGLAKLLVGGAVRQTRTGDILGTPSYMAPEQAEGKGREVGPAADVYALGAILYEVLTGRPPFEGATAADTVQQVLHQEPVPLSRLQPKVPRDLETVCLKCLEKDPQRRYASAAALADDLGRFRDGRPVMARPVGRLERAWRWGKRNPREAVIVVLALALLLLGASIDWWLERRQAAHRADLARQEAELALQKQQARVRVVDALAQLPALRQRFLWDEAEVILKRAEWEAKDLGLEELQPQVQQAQTDLGMAARLDQIRVDRALTLDHRRDFTGTVLAYREAFRSHGLDLEMADAAELAGQIQGSAIREELVAALDVWASLDNERSARLLAVARLADPDPWKDRLRDPKVWQDAKALKALAGEADVSRVGPSLLSSLGMLLGEQEESLAIVQRVQQRYPADFWLNFDLGNGFFAKRRWDDAIGYYRAAVAVRPQSAAAYNNLGNALDEKDRRDEAIAAYQEAIRLKKDYAFAHYNLGIALARVGRVDEAIAAYQEAIRLKKDYAFAHYNLGMALAWKGLWDGAIAANQEAIRLQANFPEAHNHLGIALARKDRLDEAIAAYQAAIRLRSNDPLVHNNLGVALTRKGLWDQGIVAYREAIRLKED